MKKISLLCATALLCGALGSPIYAEAVFKVNDVPYEHGDAICMNHDNGDLISVTYLKSALIWDNAADFSAHWGAIGDLELVSETDSTATFRSTNLGKGVARLYYNSGCCGAAVDLHIYKEFAPDIHNLEIEGPTCLTPGETVVFSVRPVLTRNLNAYIGVDSYYWNLTDTGINKPSFVDRIVYAAGDGSSVTFVAGTVHAGDEVRVNFGQCNRDTAKTISKQLGKLPPAPQVADATLCVPYGGAPIETITVLNPVDSVEYTCEVPSQYTARKRDALGHEFEVTFDSVSANDIKIRANYIGEEACGSSETTIHVVRTWGSNVSLVYQDAPQENCCAEISSGSYTFAVSGDIPQNSNFYWQLPTGWEYDSNYSEGQVIHIYPTASALAMDTLRVWGDACNDENVVVKTLQVYVKPASVVSIEHPACVSAGDSVMFRAVLGNNGVAPVRYHWSTSDNINLDMFTGDSVIFAPTSATTTVSVQPMGAVCAGDTCTDTLSFVPIAPTGIVSSGCIAYNMPDTVTFSIVNPIENQQYAWIYPENWTLVASRDNGSEIDLRTVGIAGAYTVGAYSVGEGECGNSNVVVDTFNINSIYTYLIYNAEAGSIAFMPRAITNVHWYLAQNGQYVGDEMFSPINNRVSSIVDPYYDLIGDIVNDSIRCSTTEYSIVVEYVTSEGCHGRFVQGKQLNPGIDYLNSLPIQNAPHRISKIVNSNQLVLSPNPAYTNVLASLQDNLPFEIMILSLEGDIVYRDNNSLIEHNIEINNLENGNYLVIALRNGRRVAVSKLMKQ